MESMQILRNLGPSFGNPYVSGPVYNGDGLFGKGLRRSTSQGGGFTMLQGHIQLMAMIPHLPENQVSPRWKSSTDLRNGNYSVNQDLPRPQGEAKYPNDPSIKSLPITPRLMPSAYELCLPNVPNLPPIPQQKVNFPDQPHHISPVPNKTFPQSCSAYGFCLPNPQSFQKGTIINNEVHYLPNLPPLPTEKMSNHGFLPPVQNPMIPPPSEKRNCCSHCKCCKSQMEWDEDGCGFEAPSERHHHVPRKEKNEVITIHESVPSVSSNSDEEGEYMTPRHHSSHKNVCVTEMNEKVSYPNLSKNSVKSEKSGYLGQSHSSKDKIPHSCSGMCLPNLPPLPNEKVDDHHRGEHHCKKSKSAHGCSSNCKCSRNNDDPWEEDRRRYEPPPPKHHSPRKKKNVVVSIHECFPSDSSDSEEDDDEIIASTGRHTSLMHPSNPDRKDTAVYKGMAPGPGFLPPSVKKRKPTLETILNKPRLKGGTEEVFDVLHDLSPDEVRLYTCQYLTDLLSSEDWSNCHIGLQTMVRMARHRPKILLSYLGPILWFAFKHITSPKSALCRAAIVTFKELFQRIGSALDNDLEKITEKLVLKSLAPNRFIREECYRALEAMVSHCTLIKVLTAMEVVSKKPNARAAMHRIARLTKQFIQVAGVDTCLKSTCAEKLLPMLFCFMMEANNETRVAAKEALAMLMNHLQFEKAVTKHVVFDRNSTEVFKKLDKMRGRNRYRGPIAATKAYNSLAQFKRTMPSTSSFFQ